MDFDIIKEFVEAVKQVDPNLKPKYLLDFMEYVIPKQRAQDILIDDVSDMPTIDVDLERMKFEFTRLMLDNKGDSSWTGSAQHLQSPQPSSQSDSSQVSQEPSSNDSNQT